LIIGLRHVELGVELYGVRFEPRGWDFVLDFCYRRLVCLDGGWGWGRGGCRGVGWFGGGLFWFTCVELGGWLDVWGGGWLGVWLDGWFGGLVCGWVGVGLGVWVFRLGLLVGRLGVTSLGVFSVLGLVFCIRCILCRRLWRCWSRLGCIVRSLLWFCMW
jgi:hypothetical protein